MGNQKAEIPVPSDLEARESTLWILWSDTRVSEPTYVRLRCACACAQCVEELTGSPLLDPRSVPDDVHPVSIEPVGRYAIRFVWSDGHGSGIYTYAHLLALDPPRARRADRS